MSTTCSATIECSVHGGHLVQCYEPVDRYCGAWIDDIARPCGMRAKAHPQNHGAFEPGPLICKGGHEQ